MWGQNHILGLHTLCTVSEPESETETPALRLDRHTRGYSCFFAVPEAMYDVRLRALEESIGTFQFGNSAGRFGNMQTMRLYEESEERQQNREKSTTLWRCCFVGVYLFVLRKKIKPSNATFVSLSREERKKLAR